MPGGDRVCRSGGPRRKAWTFGGETAPKLPELQVGGGFAVAQALSLKGIVSLKPGGDCSATRGLAGNLMASATSGLPQGPLVKMRGLKHVAQSNIGGLLARRPAE